MDLTPGTTIRHDFTLTEQAISLQEVVVTGTAGRLERKAQAAVVEKLDAARVTEVAPVNNFQTLLQARVPGVHLDAGSGSVGTAPTIRIRGQVVDLPLQRAAGVHRRHPHGRQAGHR